MKDSCPLERRRGLRFSLRVLLAAFTMCALLIGCLSQKAHQQKRLVRWIDKVGGEVSYKSQVGYAEWCYPIGPVATTVPLENWERRGICGWLPSCVDRDWVDNVSAVRLYGTRIPTMVFEHVRTLRHLEYLDVGYADFNRDDLGLLVGLEELKFLHLQWTCIGDGELAILSRITAIEELELTDTRITDTGLTSLVRLPNLKTLCVGSTHITSAGMSTLKSCRTLEQLDVSRTTVDDCGLQYLAGLTHLRVVNLQSTSVTETGVNNLRHALPSCKVVHLEDSCL